MLFPNLHVIIAETIMLFPNSHVINAEAIKTLQVLNRASWQETFLALWLSALRLVQRVEMIPYQHFSIETYSKHIDDTYFMLCGFFPGTRPCGRSYSTS